MDLGSELQTGAKREISQPKPLPPPHFQLPPYALRGQGEDQLIPLLPSYGNAAPPAPKSLLGPIRLHPSQGLWNPRGAPAPLLRAPYLLGCCSPTPGVQHTGYPELGMLSRGDADAVRQQHPAAIPTPLPMGVQWEPPNPILPPQKDAAFLEGSAQARLDPLVLPSCRGARWWHRLLRSPMVRSLRRYGEGGEGRVMPPPNWSRCWGANGSPPE